MVLFLHHSVMLPHHRPVTAPAAPADQGFEFLDLLFRQEGLSLFDGADAVEGDVGAFFRSPAHKLLGGGQIHFVGLERLADINRRVRSAARSLIILRTKSERSFSSLVICSSFSFREPLKTA